MDDSQYLLCTYLCILLLNSHMLISRIHMSYRGDTYTANVMKAVYEAHRDTYICVYIYEHKYVHSHLCSLSCEVKDHVNWQ